MEKMTGRAVFYQRSNSTPGRGPTHFRCSSQKGSALLQPGQLRGLYWSSWLLTLTVVQAGMEWVMNTLEPMTLSRPITVPPPKMDAPA